MPQHIAHRIPLDIAQEAAQALREKLAPYCERIEIAGSIRRQRSDCKDIELVAIPLIAPSQGAGMLFADDRDQLADFLQLATRDPEKGLARPRRSADADRSPPWGERYKVLAWFYRHRWLKVDLFTATPETWGTQFAIRTGGSDFSRLLVTQRVQGGAMPVGHRLADHGTLQHRRYDDHGQLEWLAVPCETETAFFQRLQIPEFPPPQRTERKLADFLRRHCYQPPDQEGRP